MRWWRVALLAGIGLVCYLGAIPSGFVLDDLPAVVRNPVVNGSVPWWEAFTRDFWGVAASPNVGTYRPLAVLSFWLDWRLGGGNPYVFHAGNVLLHALVVALSYLVFRRLAGDRVAWLGAAVLAVFAAPAEAVQGIVGRADLLQTVAIVLGLVAHRQRGTRGALLAAICYAAALGTKESGVLAVVAWTCLDWFRPSLKSPLKERRGRYALYVLVLAGYLALRYRLAGTLSLPRDGGLMNPLAVADFGGRFFGAGRIFVEKYLVGFFNPAHRLYCCNGLGGRPSSPTEPVALLGVVVLVALAVSPFLLRRRAPNAAVGLGWFVLFFLPVSNLLVPSISMYAERLLYLPMVGLGLSIAAGTEWIAQRLPQPLLARGLLGAALVGNFAAVQVRHLDWRSEDALYLSGIEPGRDCAIVQANAATVAYRHKDAVQAEHFARQALELQSPYPIALSILASSLDRQGKAEEAEAQFLRAMKQTDAWEIVVDYARFLGRHRRWEEAVAVLDRALQRDEHNHEVRAQLEQARRQRDRQRDRQRTTQVPTP